MNEGAFAKYLPSWPPTQNTLPTTPKASLQLRADLPGEPEPPGERPRDRRHRAKQP